MKIGILIAIQTELDAFMEEYAGEFKREKISGFDVFKIDDGNNQIFAINSGAGQTYAAAATMLLIGRFEVEVIINYGVVGALRDGLKARDLCVIEKIVHYCFDTSVIDNCEVGRHIEYDDLYIFTDKKLVEMALNAYKSIQLVTCASGEKFVDSVEERLELGREFKADICEMEAAAIELIADKVGVPCLFLKSISDSLYGGADEYEEMGRDSSNVCVKMVKEFIKTNMV